MDPYIAGKPTDETVAPLTFIAADGPWLITNDGRRILDWSSTLNAPFGHGVRLDTARLPVNASNYTTPERAHLAEQLAGIFPYLSGFQLRSSGTESVEAAHRYVRFAFAEAVQTVAIAGCYHGLTLGAQQLMGLAPAPGHELLDWHDVIDADAARTSLRRMLDRGPTAIWLEGVQGGTLRPLPGALLRMLDELRAERQGRLVVVVDDMLASIRVGEWCSVASSLRPDILIAGKSWSSGFPFSFFGVSAWLREAAGDVLGTTTYGGNPVACAYASYTIERLQEERTLERVREVEATFGGEAWTALADAAHVISTHWSGALFGLTLTSAATARALAGELAARGLLVTQLGPVIRCSPPLNATHEHLDLGLALLDEVVRSTASV